MKIDLFDVDEFVDINGLEEISSPVLFERGGIPNPNGLISNEIFGVSIKSRRETFGYINLVKHFFHPHIYKVLRRVFRNVDKILNGEVYYSIDKSGHLVKDPAGETGLDFLYNNWEKIKWDGNGGMSSERANLISKSKKNEVFMSKQIVIPAFYRDIKSSSGGDGGKTIEINNYYTKIIRMAALIRDQDMFDFSFHTTLYNMQKTIVDIYDYFKDKLDKKSGLLRKYLLGKNVDYCVRAVISAPTFKENDPKRNMIDFRHAGVPVAQVCSLCYPFIIAWLRNFFERELMENKLLKYPVMLNSKKLDTDVIEVRNPESFYNDEFIKRHVDKFVSDPSSRYDKIPVPLTNGKVGYLVFQGRNSNIEAEKSGIRNRYMTWTDLLYIAATEVTENKHVMVTRYPILNNFGIFLSRIRVLSTLETTPININGKIYQWYPNIDINMSKHDVANNFIDTIIFSNSYLNGLDGDYDGDQITAKIPWTIEANEECERVMNSKSFILSPNCKNMRTCDNESIQTLYVLTK